jgi:WD40 repeat protein
LSVNYSVNGNRFCTSASDNNIRIYDGETHQQVFSGHDMYFKLISEVNGSIGHTNRIFCAKFHPKEPNMLISGGWDDNILIWDSRVLNPVRSIFGPKVCGDSIDIDDSGSKVLTGSYRNNPGLQEWSWNGGELQKSIKWAAIEEGSCMLYSASYSKSKEVVANEIIPNRYILAGGIYRIKIGAGTVNEVKIFNAVNGKCAGTVDNLNCSVFATVFSPNDRMVAVGGGGKMLMVFNIEEQAVEAAK